MRPIFENYREIIQGFSGFQESLMRPLPVHLRVNRLKIEPGPLVEMLGGKGIHLKRATEMDETLFFAPELKSPGNLLEYFLGYIHPQALTSCLASLILYPKPGSYVLDMCASPGAKTSHLAQLMGNRGLIVANEPYRSRHIPLAHTLKRLGVLNVVVTAYQAQEFPLKQHFDYVLADVPCTGEGRFRMTGAAPGPRDERGRARLSELQKRIILRGYDLLKDDGEMVYATCTYNPEENESVVHFLLRNRDAELLPIHLDLNCGQGIFQWKSEKYDRRLERTVRFYPHQVDSVGFFMARIVREKGDRRRLFSYLEGRFGIPEDHFNGYLLFKKKSSWWLLKNSPQTMHASHLKVSLVGLRAFNQIGVFVKPTTRMIQIFGHLATKSRIDISEQQLQRLLSGDLLPFDLKIENGYVMLFFKDKPLGLGLLINGMVQSQLPLKGLTRFHL